MLDKKYNIAVLAALVLLLNACAITQDYVAPNTADAPHLFRLDSLVAKGDNVGQLGWEQFFKDETLKGYIQTALTNNYDNKIAMKNIAAFEAAIKQSKAAYWPTVNADANVQRQKQSENTQFGSFVNGAITQYSLSVNVAWEADLWGRMRSAKQAAQAQFLQSITAQQLLQTTLISNVATTYYQLLEADERKKMLEKTLLLRQESINTLQALKDAGQSNALAVSQAQAQLSQTQILLTTVEGQIYRLENALNLLLGQPQQQLVRTKLEEQSSPDYFAVGVEAELLSHRPDVKEAELAFRYAFEQYNIAQAAMYPKLTLSANTGYQSLEASSWFSTTSLLNTLIAGVAAPIVNGRQLKTQKERSKIEMEQSLLRFQQKVLAASMEVNDVMKDYAVRSENLQVLQEQEALLLQSFEDAKDLLTYGMANYLDVLNAQSNLLDAQLQRIELSLLKLQSTTQIYRALGGGTN